MRGRSLHVSRASSPPLLAHPGTLGQFVVRSVVFTSCQKIVDSALSCNFPVGVFCFPSSPMFYFLVFSTPLLFSPLSPSSLFSSSLLFFSPLFPSPLFSLFLFFSSLFPLFSPRLSYAFFFSPLILSPLRSIPALYLLIFLCWIFLSVLVLFLCSFPPFFSAVSPRLTLLTVRVLKTGTRALGTRGAGYSNKGYFLFASVLAKSVFGFGTVK